jgi:hypothetical protein
VAEEELMADWKKDLQTSGAGRESRKRPTLVMGQKPYGKCQIKHYEYGDFLSAQHFGAFLH